MPEGDLIFQRLDRATDGELAAMAIALNKLDEVVELSTRQQITGALSRWLRADASSSLLSLFSGDHELPYFQILKDVISEVASQASWQCPPVSPGIPETRIEDYIVRALIFASNAQPSATEREQARKEAEYALYDTGQPSPDSSTGALVLGAVGALGAMMFGALPLGIILSAAAIAAPALRRTVPAVLVLIHIRHRIRVEESLLEVS